MKTHHTEESRISRDSGRVHQPKTTRTQAPAREHAREFVLIIITSGWPWRSPTTSHNTTTTASFTVRHRLTTAMAHMSCARVRCFNICMVYFVCVRYAPYALVYTRLMMRKRCFKRENIFGLQTNTYTQRRRRRALQTQTSCARCMPTGEATHDAEEAPHLVSGSIFHRL